MADIRIEGLEGLQNLLDQFPARMEANVVRGGLRAAAKVIRDEARRRCPVGDPATLPKGHEPGALRDSIRVSVSSRHGKITASIKAGGKGNVYYAPMVEYGTARHLIKPKNRKSLFIAGLFKELVEHPGATKKPFMRPALDAKCSEAADAIATYIRKRLADLVGK
ncbi:MAG: HK97 gp10 family phage protein [Alphaproteobacteria bacterium]|nr:HK97 gp10 family phage protein [Alphaproteobacteria bacterium]